MELTHTALGTWSGGRFMHFGEAIEADRLRRLLRPGDGIDTVITADVYGQGAADVLLGEAIVGVERDSYCLAGAIGHDFYHGARDGAKGFPRFTDPRLRGPREYSAYIRRATEQSLARLGVDHLDVLLLHNPDSVGYRSEEVWEGMRAVRDAGLTAQIGLAPGPANGFTLDVIGCFERFGQLIDAAMIILSPMEPWPGELVLDAAAANEVSVITRVVDYGGLFHGDVHPGHAFAQHDHRAFRPEGWVQRGAERLEAMLPYAERHRLTPIQLACCWNLAHAAVRCAAPTLIQEIGAAPNHDAKRIEEKRAELAAVPRVCPLSEDEVAELRVIGDNTGSMTLKGASAEYEGEELPDRWPLAPDDNAVAERWQIEPGRDLAHVAAA
ncbi:MAG: aldo/keto reductase [Solirubrobacteraceae bacterium]